MKISSTNNNICFGLKNDAAAAKRILKNAEPELKKDIIDGVNAFCDITQKRGVKGSVVLKSLDGDILTYTIKPVKTGEVKKLSVDTSKTAWKLGSGKVPRRETIKRSLLNSIDYLFN